MPVYVDRLRDWGWRYGPSCHMIADTLDELHAMAARIGMKRIWFQTDGGPHYDLTASRRKMAIDCGAIEMEGRAFFDVLRKLREAND